MRLDKLHNAWQPGVPLQRTIDDVMRKAVVGVAKDTGWPAPKDLPSFVVETPAEMVFRRQLALARLMPGSPLVNGAAIIVDPDQLMEWDDATNAARITTDMLEHMLGGPVGEFAVKVHHELVHEAQSRRYPDFMPQPPHTLTSEQVNARMALLEGHATHFERLARKQHGLAEDNGSADRPFPRATGFRAWFRPDSEWHEARYGAGALLVKAVLAQRPELLEKLFEFPELAEVALMPSGEVRIDLQKLARAGVAASDVEFLRGLNPNAPWVRTYFS